MSDMQTTQQGALEVPPIAALANQLTLADHLVYKKYLPELQDYLLVEPTEEFKKTLDPEKCIKMFHLEALTLKKGEDMLQKLSTVYHASMALGCGLAVLIDVSDEKAPANIYLGVRQNPASQGIDNHDLTASGEALERGMESNFPGLKLEELDTDKLCDLLRGTDGAFCATQSAIASVSCVASSRDKSKTENKDFIQGIERFIDAMDGNTYTALFLAEPVTEATQAGIRNGYEELYSALSPFRKTTWSYSENESSAVMETLCTGTSTSVTDGTSDSKGTQTTFSVNAGINSSTTNTRGGSHEVTKLKLPSKEKVLGIAAGAGILAVGAIAVSVVFPPAGAVVAAVKAGAATAATAVAKSPLLGELIPKETNGESWSNAKSICKSFGIGLSKGFTQMHTESHNEMQGESRQHQNGTTETHGTGKTRQIEVCNKSVDELLNRIDEQIKRTKESEDYGCYSCAAYFLSSRPSKALLAANTYRALMIGEGSSVESGAINLWRDPVDVEPMKEYLRRFTHPAFARRLWTDDEESLFYTAGTMVSGRELPMHLGLPNRSVHGLLVTEHAEFGRNVPSNCIKDADKINLGKIYHMGKEEAAELLLNQQAMASHTFITGSTGAGKSNAVYHLLDELTKDGKTTFLVVEPAKGEYKHVFGSDEAKIKAAVYGTNPARTPLLRINPFEFPAEIHVLEHVDRLTEIFNACWPMYAAMPAVLKDAIECCYQNAGWDLRRSVNTRGTFPTLFDLMDVLPDIIQKSHYSNEVQSNYVGALCTRVNSLTNGIYGSVFCAEDALSDAELFDRNVIVDLSRVSSMETKSLLMGILVMKLQEYRMCSSGMNSRLRHVTVLEEAHNLLRRTAAEQSQESANLQGKSVEMLANAIAEMRTYGEGFIIADQAPGLLDASVIRNTNTKIILRLPDEEDRKLVGASASLKEEQINELAKLELGVAAVYQNEWPEAVLCKIEKYPEVQARYHKPETYETVINTEFVFQKIREGKPIQLNGKREFEQFARWLNRYEGVLGVECCQALHKAAEGQPIDKSSTERIVKNFFGGIDGEKCVRAYLRALKDDPCRKVWYRLENQYGLEPETAKWVLHQAVITFVKECPNRKFAENLSESFKNHETKEEKMV